MHLHEETLFNEALEIVDPAARAEYLKKSCEGNEALQRRIERLIVMFPQGEMLEPTMDSRPSQDPIVPGREQVGETIGPYKLLEKLGEGGMGIVYMAEQLQPIRRKVALKIIKAGMDTGQVVARFEAERQVLALMNHPNIAKVLDAGATELGRPYFVMELVRGIPITEFCNVQKLTLRERLQLFVSVCEAVHHAHQKGIIHRDLKPSNLLVELHDVKSVPKVIDFGIAKATNQQLTERTMFTNYGQVIGTPMYMSPEQARQSGLDIDIRSDIYSLGVLLYELLTGTTPITKETLSKVGYYELRRMIQEEEPPRPSARISTLKAEALSTLATNQRADGLKISHRLRGELDWVVVKALDKDRTRRYQSALEFGDDINRFLNGEPIEAHPPSIAYRLSKIVRRHRAALFTAAALLLVLLTATAISIRYAFVANSSSREAESRRKEAENSRDIADKEKTEAEIQRNEAQRLQAEAVLQKERIRSMLYNANMRFAANDFANQKLVNLRRKLMEQVPKPNDTDYRRWEWYSLQAAAGWSERAVYTHRFEVKNIAWSHDGKFIASVSRDGLNVWDPATASLKRSFTQGPGVSALACSPDGQTIAWSCNSKEGAIRLWNLKSQTQHQLVGHTKILNCLSWSPDGTRLASVAQDSICRIWDVRTEKCILELNCDVGVSNNVIWSPLDQFVVAGGQNGLKVWNPSDGTLLKTCDLVRECQALSVTPDGDFLVVAKKDGSCDLIKTDNWETFKSFTAHKGKCTSVSVSRKMQLATGGEDGVIRVWTLPECEKLTEIEDESKPEYAAWDPTGDYLAGSSNIDKIWNLNGRPSFKKFSVDPSTPVDITVLPGGSMVRVTLAGGESKILNLRTFALEHSENDVSVFDLRFVDRQIATEELVKLANLELNGRHGKLPSAVGQRLAMADEPDGKQLYWSPDRRRLAIPSYEFQFTRSMRVWDLTSKTVLSEFRIPGRNYVVNWGPDSQRLCVSGKHRPSEKESETYVYDTTSGKTIHVLKQGFAPAASIEWSSGGDRIAIDNGMNNIQSWDASTGELLATSGELNSTPRSLAWSTDLSRIAVGRDDGHVSIVDSQSGEELLDLNESTNKITCLKWSENGASLIGIDSLGSVLVWDASSSYDYARSDEYRLEILSQKSFKHVGRGEFVEAEPLLNELISLREDSIAFRMGRSVFVYAELGNHEDGIIDHKRLTELEPENVTNWINLALSFFKTDQVAKGFETLKSALEAERNHPVDTFRSKILAYRAQKYQEFEQLENARHNWEAATDPALVIPTADRIAKMVHLAIVHVLLNEVSEYQKLCKRMLDKELDAESSGYAIIACVLRPNALEDYEELIKMANQLYKPAKGENREGVAFFIGAALFRGGKYDRAREILTSPRVRAHPSDASNIYFLALCHHKLGNHEEARNRLDGANVVAEENLVRGKNSMWDFINGILRNEATKMIQGDK